MNAPVTNDNSNKYKCSIYIKALSAIAIDQVNTLNMTAIVMKTIETQIVFFTIYQQEDAVNAPVTNDNSNKYKCSIFIKALSAIAIDQVNTLNMTAIAMKTIKTQLVFLQFTSRRCCECSDYKWQFQ